MSDTTHEAPERIWLCKDESYWENGLGIVFTFHNGSHDVEYVRAKRIEQLAATNEELMAENKNLRHMIIDQIEGAGDDPEIMAASRAEWAARAKAAEAKLAWQPIETAPKDGTEIIVGASLPWHGWRCDMVAWDKNRTMWWDNNGLPYQPTHWMPLPAPPSQN